MKIDTKILSDKITPDMLQPKTSGSAGIDLIAVSFPDEFYGIIYPGQIVKIGTGIAIHINREWNAGLILPRSGTGSKGLVLSNTIGLIDSDYQGEIILSVWNRSCDPIKINQMDRIAQLIIVPVIQPQFNFVESFVDTDRGDGAFGSTGISVLSK